MRYDLRRKNVVLTGASGGFGAEMTKRLVKEYGCRVIGIGRREEAMKRLSDALSEDRDRFSYRLFDVTDSEAWTRFCEEMPSFQPDVLICCAGILPPFASCENAKEGTVGRAIDVNYLAAVTAQEKMMPYLLSSKDGAVLFVSSSSALCPVAGAAAYSASKAALFSYAEALGAEMRGRLYVGVLCPGFSMTGIFREQSELPSHSFIGRIATPPDKMAAKLLNGVSRRKKRVVCGFDAHLMRFGYRVAPTLTVRVMRAVLKRSGLAMFEKV